MKGRKKKVDIVDSVDILEIEAGLNASKRQEDDDDDKKSSKNIEKSIDENDLKEEKEEEGKSEKNIVSPPSFRNPLECNLSYGFSDVEFIYPHLTGYWPTQEDVPRYLNHGYIFCKKEWVKNYDSIFPFSSPGEGSNPDGMIPHKGHVLMVASEEISNARTEFYRKRIVDPRETIQGNLSEAEINKRNLNGS